MKYTKYDSISKVKIQDLEYKEKDYFEGIVYTWRRRTQYLNPCILYIYFLRWQQNDCCITISQAIELCKENGKV